MLPITGNVESLYPGEAMVEVKGKPGRALGDQIRSIGKIRLRARIGRLTVDEMSRIDEALAITLDLPVQLDCGLVSLALETEFRLFRRP